MQFGHDVWRRARRAVICVGSVLGLCALAFCPSLNFANADAVSRTLSFYNIHTHESLTVTYKVNDRYVPSAMRKIDYFMRDWRANKVHRMDPELIDLIWTIYTELGAKQPINLICGYRTPATNERLRLAGGGQARHSQHTLGKAADIQIPGVSVKTLRNSALITEWGGVGYYPRSGWPFVHVDVGRVRMWPRLPRLELAALFPSGHSGYIPADGRPITPRDSRIAAASGRYQLASEVFPNGVAPATAIAAASPPPMPARPPLPAAALASASAPASAATPMLVSYQQPASTTSTSADPAPPQHQPFVMASADAGASFGAMRKLVGGGSFASPLSVPDAAPAPEPAMQATARQGLSFHFYRIDALSSSEQVASGHALAPLVHPEQHNLAYIFEDLDGSEPQSLRDTAAVMAEASSSGFSLGTSRSADAAPRHARATALASR